MNLLRIFSLPLEPIEYAWTGDYPLKGRLEDADCVLGLSFGYRGKGKHIEPGLSNQDLAAVAYSQYDKLPKILQFEIADAYADMGGKGTVLPIRKHRKKGKYLDTREVVAQAKELMRQRGWKTAILLAHPHHMSRVQLVCDRLKLDWVAVEGLKGAVEFDPKSTQKWTRSLDQWRGYEPQALAYYQAKGWI